MVKIYLGAFITPRTSYIQNSGEQQEWGGRDPSLLPNELAVATYHLGRGRPEPPFRWKERGAPSEDNWNHEPVVEEDEHQTHHNG
jgi:hypothetical protein